MAQARAAGPLRILVADDDEDMRLMLAATLRRDGYAVVEARSGVEALARLADDGPVDLVVSDVRMPTMGGLDLVARMRDAGLSVPVVLVTAFGDAATHAEARRLGAVGVLDKPFDLDDLRTVVLNLLPRR